MLRARIAKVRSLGHAVIDSEYIMGVVSVSVPVFDRDRRVIAAIGATAYKPKRSAKELESIIPVMKVYSKRLTQVL
jgi:IclR family pca regulon transcriptional regulator